MSGRRRFTALLVAVLAGLAAVLTGAVSSAAAPAYRHRPHISCTFLVLENHRVQCTGDGYLPNDLVKLTLHTTTYNLGNATADASGHFSADPQLPPGVTGTHTIKGVGRGGAPNDSASTQISIRSIDNSGVDGINTALTTSGTGGSSAGSSGLSTTGVAVIGLGVVGVGLIVGGGLLLYTGRRRRQALI